MADKDELQSRREHGRTNVRGLAFVTLYWDKDMVLGQLLDISKFGLAFKYIPQIYENFNCRKHATGDLKMDIFVQSSQEWTLEGVPCKVVYEYPQPLESQYCTSQFHRCAVRFEYLSQEQSEKLLQLLGNGECSRFFMQKGIE